MAYLLDCPKKHEDCFALKNGKLCNCLADTDFGERDCPFYKSKEQREKELRKISGRKIYE